jgi:uncharacterized protein (UPF0335 family)
VADAVGNGTFPGETQGKLPETRVGGIDVERLRRHIEAIENLESDIGDLNRDKSERYQLAKADGFNLAAMRVVIKRRRMDRADRVTLDYDADLYERALGGLLPPDEPTPPHKEAQAAGRIDALSRTRQNAHRWPNGEYGHADYEIGYHEGEQERDAAEPPSLTRARTRGTKRAAEAFAS